MKKSINENKIYIQVSIGEVRSRSRIRIRINREGQILVISRADCRKEKLSGETSPTNRVLFE